MANVMMDMDEEEMMSMKEEVDQAGEEGSSMEDEGFMSLIEGLTLSPKALSGLVNSVNKVLGVFGLPSLKGKELNAELARALAMIEAAVSDAGEEEEVPMELMFRVTDLGEGDSSVMVVAGKMDRLSKTPSFKKFLKSGQKEMPSNQAPMGDQMAMDKTAEQGPDIEKLFASRMQIRDLAMQRIREDSFRRD